jgi:NADH:ubiquinone oxidoreductase subunit 6 (subunit J)
MTAILFYVFAALAVGSALVVVASATRSTAPSASS